MSVPTVLGGIIATLALVCIVALWAVLGVQRQQVPYVYSTSIGGLSEEQQTLPVGAAPGVAVSGLSGISIIVTAASGTGSCGNMRWEAVQLLGGSFNLSSSASCGKVAQHVFSCPDCVLMHGSRLLVRLPWDCQAIALEAYGVSSIGAVTVWSTIASPDVRPAAVGTPINQPVWLLSSVRWEVVPMLNLQTLFSSSTAKPSRLRGYDALGGTLHSGTTMIFADEFLPRTLLHVDVSIDLSPSPIYQEVVVTERVPVDMYITR